MLNYRKNKNGNLLKELENTLGASSMQNYIPIYNRFFTLNETNWNSINLDHPNLKDIEVQYDTIYCNNIPVFVKFSPLLDPLKYLIGKYQDFDFTLPTLTSTPLSKLSDPNNSSYVDGFFTYLTGKMLDRGFLHGINFFGSFLGIKQDFTYNVEDDLDFLGESEYFHSQKGTIYEFDREFSFSNSHKNKPKLVFSDEPIEFELNKLDDSESISTESYSDDGMNLHAIIKRFPVQCIAMEKYKNTLDSILHEISSEELNSALMQIIMTLIVYQKVFRLTHNDLHTNNVMYVDTDITHLYYRYNHILYEVPTFGKLYKIIDFGRSIYTFQGKLFVSDSFHEDGDAATQYNTEPYFNPEEPRIDPNFSFDLCRLACSIIETVPEEEGIYSVIHDWCKDDEGESVIENEDGVERYPDFELYCMIASTVHNHTPQVQLNRPEFKQYETKSVNGAVMDIDVYESF